MAVKRRTIFWLLKQALELYPGRFMLLILLGFISIALEVAGITMVFPVFSALAKETTNSDVIHRFIKSGFDSLGIPFTVGYLLAVTGILFFFKGIFTFITTYYQDKIRVTFRRDMRNRIFDKVLRASWPLFVAKKIGHLMNITITQTEAASVGIKNLSLVLVSAVFCLVYLGATLYCSWKIVLCTIVLSSFLLFFVRKVMKRSYKLGKTYGQKENELNQAAVEGFSLAKFIKGTNREEHMIRRFDKFARESADAATKNVRYKNLLQSSMEPISVIATLAIIFYSHYVLNFGVGKIMVFGLLFLKLYRSLSPMITSYRNTMHYIPLYEMCANLYNEAGSNKEVSGEKKIDKLKTGIKIENVSFSYNEHTKVLKDINCEIPKGIFLGITGPSGGGKTTFSDLILGLQQPDGGRILIDDIPLTEVDIFSWREKIGFVAQDSYLFNASIFENIAFGDNRPDRERALEMARKSGVDLFAEKLPEGYDTIIGDRGVALSGGQKQRIALARALYRQPEVLILDEATSNLDSESELSIQQSIERVSKSITVIAIAHRLKTIERADRIIVMGNGGIIEEGTKEDLTKSDSAFRQLIAAGSIAA